MSRPRRGAGGHVLALIAALPRELDGVLRHMTDLRRVALGDTSALLGVLRGQSVVAAACGVGEERAVRAAGRLLERFPIHALLSLGFAGALVAELDAGALVLPTQLRLDGTLAPVASDAALLARLEARAAAEGWRAKRAISVTAGRMVTAPEERRRLAARSGASVVDMEGYWLASACAARGVPFAGLRAVSDTVNDHLPALERALGDGRLRPGRAVRGYLGNPGELLELPRLARGARRASHALRGFVLAAAPAAAEAPA